MENERLIQLSMLVNRNPDEVLDEVRTIYELNYDSDFFFIVENAFRKIVDLFNGDFPGYRSCNMEYHDLNHTLETFLATARLIDGKNMETTPFKREFAEDMLIAALFHDSGYIQEEGDSDGTGAKYTKNHVERSVNFVKKHRSVFMLDDLRADNVQGFVVCTGLSAAQYVRGLATEEYILGGSIIGTSDLIGQMADRAYLEKLLFLYYEFREAGIPGFNTEFDVLRKTLDFYSITQDKLNNDFRKVYSFAQIHFSRRYSIDRNLYMEAIENQMCYLKEIISDETTNFRKKLKRMDLENVVPKVS